MENTTKTSMLEAIDLAEVLRDLMTLPEPERSKIKYIIQGAALVVEKEKSVL